MIKSNLRKVGATTDGVNIVEYKVADTICEKISNQQSNTSLSSFSVEDSFVELKNILTENNRLIKQLLQLNKSKSLVTSNKVELLELNNDTSPTVTKSSIKPDKVSLPDKYIYNRIEIQLIADKQGRIRIPSDVVNLILDKSKYCGISAIRSVYSPGDLLLTYKLPEAFSSECKSTCVSPGYNVGAITVRLGAKPGSKYNVYKYLNELRIIPA